MYPPPPAGGLFFRGDAKRFPGGAGSPIYRGFCALGSGAFPQNHPFPSLPEKAGAPGNGKKEQRSGGGMIFYGWLVVFSGFLVLLAAWGCQFSFGVFLVPLSEHFGWSRAETAGIFSLNILVFGAGSIFSGKLMERFGPRAVVGAGGVLMAGGLVLSAAIQSLWQLYLAYGLIIGLGTSTTWGPLAATVPRWFVARRGLAMGIMSLGISLGIMAVPSFSRYLITHFGWRTAFAFLGLLTGFFITGTSWLLKRDPQEKGLHPYGQSAGRVPPGKDPLPFVTERPDWKFSEAIGSRTFWMLFAAYLLWLVGFYMVSVHLAAYGTDSGLTPAASALAVSLIGAGSIFGKVFMGFISDRIGPQRVLVLNMFLQGVSIFGLAASGDAAGIFLSAGLFGFAYGGIGPQLPVVAARFFGLAALASIFGALIFAGHVGGAIGPLLGGKIFDLSRTYFWSFSLGGVAVMISLGLIFFLRPPVPRKKA
jgi:MFS transporter, OFA family, oxalate/formate antiporter